MSDFQNIKLNTIIKATDTKHACFSLKRLQQFHGSEGNHSLSSVVLVYHASFCTLLSTCFQKSIDLF